jgi:WD40 repeat protein
MNAPCSLRWLALGVLFSLAPSANAQRPRLDAAGDPLPDDARLRIGSMRFREGGYLNAASLAPDGKTVALLSGQGVRLLEVATGKEIRRFSIREYPRNNQLHYTADGRQMITVGYNGITFLDVEDGKQLRHVPINRQNPGLDGSISLSADGKLLAQGSMDRGEGTGSATVFELEASKELMKAVPVQNAAVHPSLSRDGKLLATWGQYYNRGAVNGPINEGDNPNRIVQLWEVATGKEKHKLTTDTTQVQTVRFSPDGSKVATAGAGLIQLWDVATGKLERRFACRSGQGASVAFSPDGRTLAASGRDSTVQLWDINSGKRLGMCEGPAVQMTQLQYRPDGQLVAWGVYGAALHIWEAPSGKRLTPEGGHQGGVYGLFFAPDSKTLISAGQDGRVIRWDPADGKELEPIVLKKSGDENRRYYGSTRVLLPYGAQSAFSPNGKYMIGGTSDYGPASAVFEMPSGIEVFSLVSPSGIIDRNGPVLFSPDSSKVTLLSRYFGGPQQQARSVTVWELETGLALPALKGQQGELTAGGFSADGKFLAIASQMRTPQRQDVEIWVWDIAAGKPRSKVQLAQQCSALVFLDERRLLAAAFQMGWRLYDGIAGKELGAFDGDLVQVTGPPVLSPDRRLVAAGVSGLISVRADGTQVPPTPRVYVWEVASGTLRYELSGHQGNVTALAFAPDGRTLATGSMDTTILLWDLAGPKGKQPQLNADEIEALWKALDERSAKNAEAAMRKLAARPEQAIPILRERLKPVDRPTIDAAELGQLIRDLDASRFAVREAASKRLEGIGKPALEPLRAALKADPSPELKERIEKLLDRLERADDMAPWLQSLRGIEVLERMGTPETKQLLAALAKGAPSAPPTRVAAEALQRLQK